MRAAGAFLLVVLVGVVPLAARSLAGGKGAGGPSVDVAISFRPRPTSPAIGVGPAPGPAAPPVSAPSTTTTTTVAPAVVTPTATQYCTPSPPASAPEYQAAFDALRTTDTGWVSADGAVPISLPDGRTVWIFGDTYVGAPDSSGRIGADDALVRNSFVIQQGGCFTPRFGGTPAAPTALIPSPAPNEWYWPASGVVDGNVLRIFLWHMRYDAGPVPSLDFQTLDVRVATFSLPDLSLVAVQPLPFPTSADRPYGATAFSAPDGNVYLFGMSGRNVYAARAPLGQLLQNGSWTFASGDPSDPSWSPDPEQAIPMQWQNLPSLLPLLGPGSGPAAQPWVSSYGSEYLATAKLADGLSDDVSVFTGPTPAGPWTYLCPIASTAAPGLAADNAMLHAPTTNPMVIYSTAPSPFVTTPPPLTVEDYGPHFESPTVALPPPLP